MLLFVAQGLAAQSRTLIEHVTVVDVVGKRHLPNRVIVIEGNRISTVARSGEVKPRTVDRRIEARGLYAIPGLWDSHVHVSMTPGLTNALPLYVANGVTSVRDLGGRPAVLDSVRQRFDASVPHIYTALNILESRAWLGRIRGIESMLAQHGIAVDTAWMKDRLSVATAQEAVTAVDSLKRIGADLVKIRNAGSAEVFRAAASRARERGLPVAAHIPGVLDLREAVDAGLTTLEHASNGYFAHQLDSLSAAQRESTWTAFIRNGSYLVPTLVNEIAFAQPDSLLARLVVDTLGAMQYELRHVPSDEFARFQRDLQIRRKEDEMGYRPDRAANHARDLRQLRDAYSEGVAFLAGTDVGGLLGVPGFSLHRELELLVQLVGLSNWDALRAATVNAAAAVRRESDVGTIAAGQRADIVLLTADPVASISNTRKIEYVIRAGVVHDRVAITRLRDRFDRTKPR